MGRKAWARIGVTMLVAAPLAVGVPSASAALSGTYATTGKILTVNSDGAGDTMVVTCASGLRVNGAAPPSGAIACNEVNTLLLNGNGGADMIDVSAVDPADVSITTLTLDGGAGDDDLRSVALEFNNDETVLGGEGADSLTVNQAEVARGGPGDDRLIGSSPAGPVEGGDGTDTFAFGNELTGGAALNLTFTVTDSGVTLSALDTPNTLTFSYTSIEAVDLVLTEGASQFDASLFSGRARVLARGGADTLIGTNNADELDGGLGNDFIDAGGGADVYQGGPGFDYLLAHDGIGDSGDCGTDDDSLIADVADVFTGCERTVLPGVAPAPILPPAPGPAPPAPDTTKPALVARAATLRGRRLRLPVTCPAGESRCVGTLTLAGVGARPKKPVPLGAVAVSLAGGGSATVTSRVSAAQRRALRRLSRRRLRIRRDIFDLSGNRTRGARRVRLRLR